jgi:hypothetical protein
LHSFGKARKRNGEVITSPFLFLKVVLYYCG